MLLDYSGKYDSSSYKEYPYRWVIVALYVLLAIAAQLPFLTFMPMSQTDIESFMTTQATVAATALTYLAAYFLFNFVGLKLADALPLRTTVIAGVILIVSGAWLRHLISISFPLVFIGQIFCAFSQILIRNLPLKTATFWFKPKTRTLITSVMGLATFAGIFLSIIFSSLLTISEPTVSADRKKDFKIALITENVIITIFAVPSLFFYENSPKPPPNYAVYHKDSIEIFETLKVLAKNSNFRSVALSYGISCGSSLTFMILLSQAVNPFKFFNGTIGLIGFVLVVFGFVGLLVIGSVAGKYRKFKIILMILLLVLQASLYIFAIGLEKEKLSYLLVAAALFGFTIFPLTPICSSMAQEYTENSLSDTLINCVLQMATNIVCIISSLVMMGLLSYGSYYGTKKGAFMIGLYNSAGLLFSIILSLLIKSYQ